MSNAGEDNEGVAPRDIVVVGVEEPVAVPTHTAEDAEGEKQENSWKTKQKRTVALML